MLFIYRTLFGLMQD